jgi:alkylhydroperoxidase family enzyme
MPAMAATRLSQPRIPPVPPAAWPEEVARQRDALGEKAPNVLRTLANHPDLMRRWGVFGSHILGKSTLPDRDRELLMLRIGWLCNSVYEFGQHTLIAQRCGVSELESAAMISDETWTALGKRYDTRQLMDTVFTVGQYNMVSWALNSFGVQLDEGVPGFPD